MSGGSYDYLYLQRAADLMERQHTVERMADRIAGLGYAPDAAQDAYDLLAMLRTQEVRIQAAIDRLADVFHAVEWWDSSDWTEGQVREVLSAYRCDTRADPQVCAGSTPFQGEVAPSGPSRERMDGPAALTFAQLREANVARCARWHPGFPLDGLWNGAD